MDLYGQKYFITFIDDHSHFIYLYLIHDKHEALNSFKTEIDKQCSKQIKIMR